MSTALALHVHRSCSSCPPLITSSPSSFPALVHFLRVCSISKCNLRLPRLPRTFTSSPAPVPPTNFRLVAAGMPLRFQH
eukprot:681557-Pleurochrysis_carterae.AAC.3